MLRKCEQRCYVTRDGEGEFISQKVETVAS